MSAGGSGCVPCFSGLKAQGPVARSSRRTHEMSANCASRQQEVQIGIPLTVGVRREVDGQVVHENGEIGAVVRIEAPDEVLRCLPPALMLRDDDTGECVQDL